MLGVWARGFAVSRPQIVSSPTVNSYLQATASRTLFTWSSWKGTTLSSPSISRPRPLLDLHLQFRPGRKQLRFNSTNNGKSTTVTGAKNTPDPPASNPPKPSVLSRIFGRSPQGISSFTKIASLAKPERKPLSIAVGLLLMSSAVSLSIPFTIGRLIDFFSGPAPVSDHFYLH